VVVLAIAFFKKLDIEHLWIHFGVGKNVRLIAIHEFTSRLNATKCEALPMFHELTGCDTVSCFHGKGKKSAWAAWNSYPEVTDALVNMKDVEYDVTEADLRIIERFIIFMYKIEQVSAPILIQPVDIYSPKNQKLWKCCLLNLMHLSSILSEPFTKLSTAGHSV
jgi:hypothetical protein